ncbi:unnamed protein product [Ectocarpus fasciculatus]
MPLIYQLPTHARHAVPSIHTPKHKYSLVYHLLFYCNSLVGERGDGVLSGRMLRVTPRLHPSQDANNQRASDAALAGDSSLITHGAAARTFPHRPSFPTKDSSPHPKALPTGGHVREHRIATYHSIKYLELSSTQAQARTTMAEPVGSVRHHRCSSRSTLRA